jgi:hypothetical protein
LGAIDCRGIMEGRDDPFEGFRPAIEGLLKI